MQTQTLLTKNTPLTKIIADILTTHRYASRRLAKMLLNYGFDPVHLYNLLGYLRTYRVTECVSVEDEYVLCELKRKQKIRRRRSYYEVEQRRLLVIMRDGDTFYADVFDVLSDREPTIPHHVDLTSIRWRLGFDEEVHNESHIVDYEYSSYNIKFIRVQGDLVFSVDLTKPDIALIYHVYGEARRVLLDRLGSKTCSVLMSQYRVDCSYRVGDLDVRLLIPDVERAEEVFYKQRRKYSSLGVSPPGWLYVDEMVKTMVEGALTHIGYDGMKVETHNRGDVVNVRIYTALHERFNSEVQAFADKVLSALNEYFNNREDKHIVIHYGNHYIHCDKCLPQRVTLIVDNTPVTLSTGATRFVTLPGATVTVHHSEHGQAMLKFGKMYAVTIRSTTSGIGLSALSQKIIELYAKYYAKYRKIPTYEELREFAQSVITGQ